MSYQPKNPIKIVTATSLFDGHDASINIMRRILQDMGAEVVHLGHNRSVWDVVKAALQEGAQGVAVSSYQGGHIEYFKYMKDLLKKAGADYVKIYGGGGGVIIHEEKRELEAYGIQHIFHPDEGRELGLEGMIEIILRGCDFNINETSKSSPSGEWEDIPHRDLGLALSLLEQTTGRPLPSPTQASHAPSKVMAEESLTRELGEKNGLVSFQRRGSSPLVLGVTGTGGAGKSSLVDELLQRFLNHYPGLKSL